MFDQQFNISMSLCRPFEFCVKGKHVMMMSQKGGAFLSVESCLSDIQLHITEKKNGKVKMMRQISTH